jgi:heat shock protein HslJ
VRAAPGENTAEYVRECQLVETVAREQLLAQFASGAEPDAAAPTGGSIEVRPTEPQTDAVVAATPTQPETLDMPAPAIVEPPLSQSDATAAVPQPADAGKRGLEWHLASWVTGGQQKALLRDSMITIAFDPTGKVSGRAGVNGFSGSYSFDDAGRLKWPPGGFAVTRMAGPPAMMAQERAFLESLRRTSRYKVDGQRLVLESANSSVVLTFARNTP